ncbi:MAG TPA: GntR family transcriptional regulator [Armatimonadetes bacterium]|jgi:DNA-binding GntR family transcriptional regulator|nr:GntR family transcriptional regulator [Armatimonadota bacterium]
MVTSLRLSEQVYEELLRLIRSGELLAGTTVTETELSDRLGVSRTPIREALTRLSQYGVVSRRPGSSVVVEAMDLSRYVQLAEVRGVLESYAARLFARNATEADIAILEQLARAVDEADGSNDLDRVVAAETEFHGFLAKRSGNSELVRMLEVTSLLTTFLALPAVPLSVPAAAGSATLHQDLVAVLRQRDPDEAERAMRNHIGTYSIPEAER